MIRTLLAALFCACLSMPAVGQTQFIPHPQGCPARAYCGCGTSVEVFGKPVRRLYLAAAWFQFPRAAPAPGMVAVRRGHVFLLKEHVEGSTWIVVDHNSGNRRSRIHHRSIAGFVIVDPHGGRQAYASAERD